MPIIKDDCENPVVLLGHGDVVINTGSNVGPVAEGQLNEIVFIQHPAVGAIGEFTSEYDGKTVDEVDREIIRLKFDSVESLDVLTERLGVVRASMLATV